MNALTKIVPTCAAVRTWMYDPFCYTPWYTAELTSALLECGAQVRLICGTLPKEPQYFPRRGLTPEVSLNFLSSMQTNRMKRFTRPLRLAQALVTSKSLISALRHGAAHPPDVIHLQQLPMLSRGFRNDFRLLNAAKEAGVPCIHTVHNLLPHTAPQRSQAVYKDLYHQVDHLICHSQHTSQELISSFGIDQNKITVLPHGPLFATPSPPTNTEREIARQSLSLPSLRTIVLYQGILSDYKGVDLLLNAWRCIQNKMAVSDPKPLLLIAGTGAAHIESAIRRATVELSSSVHAELRYITTEELPAFYRAADILVYPYRSITTSGALLTGLSYQKPIIASDLEPFHDYLRDGENALLVKPGSVPELADALHQLVGDGAHQGTRGDGRSNPLLERLSRGAMQNRQRYVDWSSIASGTLRLYESLTPRPHEVPTLRCKSLHTA